MLRTGLLDIEGKWPLSGIPNADKHKAIMGAPITVLESLSNFIQALDEEISAKKS